jgi:hypothetical protein
MYNQNSHEWAVPTKIIPLTWVADIIKTAANWDKQINAKKREAPAAIKKREDIQCISRC